MICKVTSMTAPEMETICRKMADAFLDYDWTPGNLGMCEYLDREHFYRFTRGYFEPAIRNGSLYCAGDSGEGYMIFETPETKGSLTGSLLQLKFSDGESTYNSCRKRYDRPAEEKLPENKEVFLMATCGASPTESFFKGIHRITDAKNCRFIGKYICTGYDTFGPLKLVGGLKKGHPDAAEIEGAVRFYEGL